MAEPLRVQIWKDLLRKIQTGKFSVGERIPTESELQLIYAASRTPVRQALDKLAMEGHIVRRPGRGTFVSNVKPGSPTAPLSGFHHYYRAGLTKITARTIGIEVKTVSPSIASMLGARHDEKLTHVHRVRLVNGQPVAHMRSVLAPRFSAEPFEKNLDIQRMPVFLLERFSVRCSHATEEVDAVLAQLEDAEILRVPEGHPLLQVRREVYDESGGPILASRYVVNSMIWKYRTSLIV